MNESGETKKLRKAVGPNLPLVMQAAERLVMPSTTAEIQAVMTKKIAREHVIRYCTQAVSLRLMVLCNPNRPRTYVVENDWRERLRQITPMSRKERKELGIKPPKTVHGIVQAAVKRQPNSVFALGVSR